MNEKTRHLIALAEERAARPDPFWEPRRIEVTQRRFLSHERADAWAHLFNEINDNPRVEAVSVRTWYGSRVAVILKEAE